MPLPDSAYKTALRARAEGQEGHGVRRRGRGRRHDRGAAQARSQALERPRAPRRTAPGGFAVGRIREPLRCPPCPADASMPAAGAQRLARRRARIIARAADRAGAVPAPRWSRCSPPSASSTSWSRSRWCSSSTCRSCEFLTDTQWTPLFDDAHFGIMVLLSGTLTSSAVALAVAIPLGTIIAIYLSRVRAVPAARDRQAVPRAARRRADHRLRLLRAAVRHAAAADDLSRAAGLQPALGRHRDGHHDHSVRELDLARTRCARCR